MHALFVFLSTGLLIGIEELTAAACDDGKGRRLSRFFPALLLVVYTATDVCGSASARDADRPYTGAI